MSKVQSVEIEVILNSNDLQKYIIHYYRKNVFLIAISCIAVVLLFAALVDMLIPNSYVSVLSDMDPLILLLCAIILFLPVIIYVLLLTTGKNFGLVKKRIYTIDKKEVQIKTDTRNINFPTNSISRISETNSTFYIWQKNAPQILPKRFMTETDIAFIRTLNK